MTKLYYTPPSNEIFEEMRKASIEVWGQYDNTYGYVDEKTGRLKEIGNVADNLMYMLAMFDHINQKKVIEKLSEEARKAVKERMIDGGNDENYLSLIGLN